MGEIVRANEGTFAAEVAADVPVIVDFTGEWCRHCRALEPVIQQLADETDVRVVKVDVDESPGLVRQFGVRGAPTLVFLRDGIERRRIVGYQTKQALLRELANATTE